MLDYSTIQDIRQRATNEAVRKGLHPARIDTALINIIEIGGKGQLIPFLGDYVPSTWEREYNSDDDYERWLVDSTGFCNEGPALSWRQFADRLKQYNDGRHGIAVIEAGEFQVVAQIYVKKG